MPAEAISWTAKGDGDSNGLSNGLGNGLDDGLGDGLRSAEVDLTVIVCRTRALAICLEWDNEQGFYFVADVPPGSQLETTPLSTDKAASHTLLTWIEEVTITVTITVTTQYHL